MNAEEFQNKIQKEIDKRLYIEPTQYEDIDRIMVNIDGKDIYICAFPKRGVREEPDRNYQSDRGDIFPHRELLEAKVAVKLKNIDLTLYD